MDPVNQAIGENQEQRELEDDVPPSIPVNIEVQQRMATDFGKKPGRSEDGHLGK